MAHNTRWRNSREKTIRSRDDRTSEVLFVEETYSSILNRVFILNLVGYWLIYVLTLYYDMQVHKFKDNNKINREMNRFETWIFWKHFHCVMNLCLFKRVTKNIVMCCSRILVVWLTNVIQFLGTSRGNVFFCWYRRNKAILVSLKHCFRFWSVLIETKLERTI